MKNEKLIKRQKEVSTFYHSVGLELLEDYNFGRGNKRRPLKTRCLAHGHEFTDSCEKIFAGNRCPTCNGVLSNRTPKWAFKDKLKEAGWTYVANEYINNQSEIVAVCKNGHTSTRAFNKFFGSKCMGCHLESVQHWNFETASEYLKNSRAPISLLRFDYGGHSTKSSALLECQIDGHKWDIIWRGFLSNKSGCPKCAGNLRLTLEECNYKIQSAGYKMLSYPEVCNNENKFTVQCPAGHQYETNMKYFSLGNRCTKCFKAAGKSRVETKVYDFVSGFGHSVVTNEPILDPYDIDAYLPALKFGIETNGLYYHSLNSPMDHLIKYHAAQSRGIDLMQVFEDEVLSGEAERKITKRLVPAEDSSYVVLKVDDSYMMQDYSNLKLAIMSLKRDMNKTFLFASDNCDGNDSIIIACGGEKVGEIEPSFWHVKGTTKTKDEISNRKVYDAGKSVWLFKKVFSIKNLLESNYSCVKEISENQYSVQGHNIGLLDGKDGSHSLAFFLDEFKYKWSIIKRILDAKITGTATNRLQQDESYAALGLAEEENIQPQPYYIKSGYRCSKHGKLKNKFNSAEVFDGKKWIYKPKETNENK